MALKTTNKNRKKQDEMKVEKEPMQTWWWVPHNPKPYFIGFGVLVLVLLFL